MKPIIFLALLFSAVVHGGERYMIMYNSTGVETHKISDIDSIKYWTTGDTLVDPRDGQKYATVVIDTQCWMAKNLNVGVYTASINTGSDHSDVSDNGIIEKYAYNNDTTNFSTYGGLYDWDEAMGYSTTEGAQGICPNGWHIPTDTEWKTLEMYLGMSSSDANNTGWRGTDQGTQLKEGGSSGFQALLAGYRVSDGSFLNLDSYGYFWSSSQYMADSPWIRYVLDGVAIVARYNLSRTNGYCVRCVKD